jgi:hypothetical protein
MNEVSRNGSEAKAVSPLGFLRICFPSLCLSGSDALVSSCSPDRHVQWPWEVVVADYFSRIEWFDSAKENE